jgi:MinD-like ATPase involved in chromosome partitioning or flagellar assembly
MPQVISIHSFRGGTGKSNTTANLAAMLASEGKRVCVIDTDIQSPGIHVIFGLDGENVTSSLNDFLWNGRAIEDVAIDVTPNAVKAKSGQIYLVPSSIKPGEITRVMREGYDARQLTEGLKQLLTKLKLDYLLIDTHPGLGQETLLSLVISNTLIVVLRPDQQDYEGTGITVRIARELKVPNILLMVNKSPSSLNPDALAEQVQEAYGCKVIAVLPHSDEMMELASRGLFALEQPAHPISEKYRAIASQLG